VRPVPIEWLQAISTGSTVALAGLTVYYVRLTHNLLKIQVEPQVEFSIAPETLELVLRNYGAYTVWNVSTEYNIRVLPGPVELYGRSADLPLVKKLSAGKQHKIPIEQVAADAIQMRKQVEKTVSSGDHLAGPYVRFSLSWQRDFDRRVFKAVRLLMVVEDGKHRPPGLPASGYTGSCARRVL
jgi:hypothetical protein